MPLWPQLVLTAYGHDSKKVQPLRGALEETEYYCCNYFTNIAFQQVMSLESVAPQSASSHHIPNRHSWIPAVCNYLRVLSLASVVELDQKEGPLFTTVVWSRRCCDTNVCTCVFRLCYTAASMVSLQTWRHETYVRLLGRRPPSVPYPCCCFSCYKAMSPATAVRGLLFLDFHANPVGA